MNLKNLAKVLTLQLKRFDYNRGFNGGKINKFIQYPLSLNLQPYMSSRKDPVPYSLYAVLVHEGFSCNSGHYYCYVKAPNGTWYLMNDSQVMASSQDKVLHQNAYLLFYLQQPTAANPEARLGDDAGATTTSTSLPKAELNQSTIGTHSNIFQNVGNTTKREKVSFGLTTTHSTKMLEWEKVRMGKGMNGKG